MTEIPVFPPIPIPIIVADDDEEERSSIWRISRYDWNKHIKQEIEDDARGRGYRNAHFNDWTLTYDRDWTWGGFLGLGVFLYFVFWIVAASHYPYAPFETVFGAPLFFSACISTLVIFAYCSLVKASVGYINAKPTGDTVLLQVFGSKIRRIKYADSIGLPQPQPTQPTKKTEENITRRCAYCGRLYSGEECSYCGGQ